MGRRRCCGTGRASTGCGHGSFDDPICGGARETSVPASVGIPVVEGNRVMLKRRPRSMNKVQLRVEELEPRLALTIPAPAHVVLVVEENHSFSQIIGSSSAPYINSLAHQGALMTHMSAIGHPSQPNYL